VIAYRIPASVEALLFDIDGTLYSNQEYGQFQIDVLIDELARSRGQTRRAIESELARARADWSAAHDGGSTSLGNAMAALGIDMKTSVAWRQRLIDPYRFLSADTRLRATLLALTAPRPAAKPIVLVAVTNNPRSVGSATLDALGVPDLFRRVVGLDDTMKSKPAPEPYLFAAAAAGTEPAGCLSIGDRYDVDLAEPLRLGMGAILVDGVADVYALPELLFGLAVST